MLNIQYVFTRQIHSEELDAPTIFTFALLYAT